jgi:hypothetical protein
MRLFGGAAERPGVGDGAEVAELMDFHRLCLSIVSEPYIGCIGGTALSDRGTPNGYRHMGGFSSHTFSLIPKERDGPNRFRPVSFLGAGAANELLVGTHFSTMASLWLS